MGERPAVLELSQTLAPGLIELRHDLHRNPELGNDLPRTQQAVLDALDGLDLEITLGQNLSSVVAVLRGRGGSGDGAERPVVLLRGDMDGLPVTEATGVEFASEREGLMHACGHDLHVAGLVGAARILHELRDELAGDVVFMFQPGEEGPGGAEPMLREGLLDVAGRRVDAAYAIHVYAAEHPRGVWFGRPGPQMAAADEVVITVQGKGGHGSQPQHALDPVPVACEIVLALQTMVTRRFDAFDPVVVTVGRISSGTVNNVIPDTAVIEATLRTFSPEHRAKAHEEIRNVAEHVAAAHRLTVTVDIGGGYPVTVNDPEEFAFAQATSWTSSVRNAGPTWSRPRRVRRTCRSSSRRCPVPTSTSGPASRDDHTTRRRQPFSAGGIRRLRHPRHGGAARRTCPATHGCRALSRAEGGP